MLIKLVKAFFTRKLPKNSRIPLAENLIPKTIDFWETVVMLIALLCNWFFKKAPRGGKRQKSSLSAIINMHIVDDVIEEKR